MRSVLLLLTAFAVAAPVSADWWPSWSPSDVQLAVGETTTVKVRAMWSGLVDYGGGIHWGFRSDNNQVATAFAQIDDQETHEVRIAAIGPGLASIRQEWKLGLGEVTWVRIVVVCGAEAPVRPAVADVRARIGEPVAIAVLSEIAERTVFHWYLGRVGDLSHPLSASGTEIAFTPTAYGTQYVWVSAITTCSTSSTQFSIDVPLLRRRAVQK
jgi:hypothetical protein